ncbi:WD40 repeat domain-containing protein, partial [Archangium violaceum]|uniref:WD40 repeat domain-containing protein n=1 Tax=Archangium violaceum TaxID=83451 RepID=UPI0005B81B2E
DGLARVWRADGRGEPGVLRGHGDAVYSAVFSPDGKWVATASKDKTVRVWRVDGPGDPVVMRGHAEAVYFAAFSRDGSRVVSASQDGTARLWTVSSARLQDILRTAISACLRPAERQPFILETADEAQGGYEQCERAYGRTPIETSAVRGE